MSGGRGCTGCIAGLVRYIVLLAVAAVAIVAVVRWAWADISGPAKTWMCTRPYIETLCEDP